MAEVQRCFLPASPSHGLSMKGCRSTVRTDVLPGLNGKGEYKVPPNTCFEPSLPPTLVYILGKEAE